MSDQVIKAEDLYDFVKRLMMRCQVSDVGAHYIADNLVTANLRGIDSHGVGRVKRYVEGIRRGYIVPDVSPKIVRENSVLGNVDARDGVGQPAGVFGMDMAIEKAQSEGIGLVTVFNSNHYGFAGYYAMRALEHNLIGISLTNSEPLVVPTFARNAILGTNPISIAAPTSKNRPWVMDLATSVVPRGKLEVYERLGKRIPPGWATDERGTSTDDPARVLENVLYGYAGGILPLGGEGETHGGHKGYGLSLMVDVLSGVLSGSNFGPDIIATKDGKMNHPRVGHFFMALDPAFFTELDVFKRRMDDYIDLLHTCNRAEGCSRIYVHGEKEYEMHDLRTREGIPLDAKTAESLIEYSKQFNEAIHFMS
ncbi:MAG: Ldh family oxidoreductase [Candidatus Thorarchaeota archaeon]|nr:Ldh family oxidoreductase [Candidatus Thorarchaeota archaeon]